MQEQGQQSLFWYIGNDNGSKHDSINCASCGQVLLGMFKPGSAVFESLLCACFHVKRKASMLTANMQLGLAIHQSAHSAYTDYQQNQNAADSVLYTLNQCITL